MANGILVYYYTIGIMCSPCILFCSGGAPTNPALFAIWLIIRTQTTYIRVNQEGLILGNTEPEKGNLKDKSPSSFEKPKPNLKTYVSQLKIWNGIYSQTNVLKIFLRPFPFLLSPVVSLLFLLKTLKSELHAFLKDLVRVLRAWNANRVVQWV